MSRTRAEALALVNWKGVFYERYLLDRHVTALEGANGAGKTTVMIAAYVVLLPDMSRLRFTNLGETGATGGDKGIWGRLGEAGRPSYAALDFRIARGERVVAGVQLERRGEPSVEPTPFIVTGLAPDVRLQELLLLSSGEREQVPELGELRENSALLSAKLQTFASTREYFATLFELGVMPLRLGTDEERGKLNEMLRTSMTGGISRALTSELRSFLLKEDGGLSDTLKRMRANLDACRRTRTEVQEAQRLEHEIGGVFDAGQTMFVAGYLATQARADDSARRLSEAEAKHSKAEADREACEAALASIVAEWRALESRREALQGDLDAARSWQARLRDALGAHRRLVERAARLAETERVASEAHAAKAEAEVEGARRSDLRRKAQENHTRAAVGLADLQQGIEELHRRAGAHRKAQRSLDEAQRCLETTAPFEPRLAEARDELARTDVARREADRRLADAEHHRGRHAKGMAALRALTETAVEVGDAHAVALEALQRHRRQQLQARRLPELEQGLTEARAQALRQARAHARARALDVVLSDAPAAEVVGKHLAQVEDALHEAREGERGARAEAERTDRQLHELLTRRRGLEALVPEWQHHAERAARLGQHLKAPVKDRADLDAARRAIASQVAEARRAEEDHAETEAALRAEALALSAAGGHFPRPLLALRDDLGAELVAGGFEDVPLDEAAGLEARLGGLAQALAVEDPIVAARAVAAHAGHLNEVLLVSRDMDLLAHVAATEALDVGRTHVLVEEGPALRVTRVPAQPRLGRRAREARAAELREQAEATAAALAELRSNRRVLERLTEDGDALLAGHAVWLSEDPEQTLVGIRASLRETEAQRDLLRATIARHAQTARDLGPRKDGLRTLLAEAVILDPPNHQARAEAIQGEHDAARAARDAVRRQAPYVPVVEGELETLRRAPLSAEDEDRLATEVQALNAKRDQLVAGIEALEYVVANAEALTWTDAHRLLAANQGLVPGLKAQLEEAEARRSAAETAEEAARKDLAAATARFQDADGARRSAREAHQEAQAAFDAVDIADPSPEGLAAATRDVEVLERESQGMEARRDELLTARGGQESRLEASQAALTDAAEGLAGVRREAEPNLRRWEALQTRAAEQGLLAALPSRFTEVRGQVNLMKEAIAQRAGLLERLRAARGGPEVAKAIEGLEETSDAAFGDACLDMWLSVREWLRRRLPAQVAEVDEPQEALHRLRDQLRDLEARLTRQEHDLRGESESVAQGIEVLMRRARGQVKRLNQNLDGVSFGSIRGIRVRQSAVERMSQVLSALRDGQAQGLLFQTDLPFEEALEQIFQRYGGGGRNGGQRLLDYREYIHLQVEVRRKAGSDWEIANPTRLSTGEAIGVGAALMMVVLTEWERDATMLRGKKAHGSLRFLFLDEANRLSHDNLGVLFDLCQTLDLQLLIAAPEVARAEGNTTYRLVRRTTSEGHEEVLVSGRRSRAEP
ncbi:MAG: chromosome partition protein MukB [Deltaproteobacteria bacterium]|nr:chromosome partition protein MukB [Deltaproteobacteria bacterium]MCB9797897.1 chromosome partition protein MukB [Alphaproteobacteria bacterium]